MLHDTDDPRTMHLLERALSTLPHLNASAIIADESGIHWKTISRTSELVQYVARHSPHAQGTFNFTATAMLKPYAPSFPAPGTTGPGGQFSIGFEGADIVRDVFTKDKGNADAAITDLTAALTIHAKVADTVGNKIAAATRWTYIGCRSHARAARRRLHRRRHRSLHRRTLRIKRHPHRLPHHHRRRQSRARQTNRLLRPHGSRHGRQTPRPALGRVRLQHRQPPRLFRRVRHRPRHHPSPGDVTLDQMNRIFSDVASLAVKWNKPLSARLQPIPGKKPGDRTRLRRPLPLQHHHPSTTLIQPKDESRCPCCCLIPFRTARNGAGCPIHRALAKSRVPPTSLVGAKLEVGCKPSTSQ